MPEPPWHSAPRRRRVPRPQLSRQVVVSAALEVVEQDGGDALTMRRVADQIGASASSLYGYVANKEELVQLVLDRIFEEVELPPEGGRWQDDLKEFGRSVLGMFRRHKGVAALTLGRVVVSSSMLAGIERGLAELRAAGMPDEVAVYVGDLLGLYVGAIAYEMDMTPAGPAEDFAAQLSGWLRSLPPDRFPNVVELAGRMAAGSADDRFEWGLDVIVRGLASYLESPPTADARWPVAE
jgi:TetR/AcrR family transcriptional regulator, tetracycline repressor protein